MLDASEFGWETETAIMLTVRQGLLLHGSLTWLSEVLFRFCRIEECLGTPLTYGKAHE